MRDLVDELLRAKVETTLFGGERAPRLGRLELLERIGAGAMGTVFRARDPRLERDVAVKVVPAGEGVLDEARALARLQHPNVVAVHDADEADGLVYIVMELVTGESLRAWKPASWRDVARVMREAAAGIAAAHAVGLVHRDIKPDNIRVGADRTRVVDFGLARAEDGDGTRAGTVEYMAPEVLAGGPATAAADQYAFGISLREKLGTDAPGWLVRIAERASAVQVRDRFPSMGAVVAALGRDRRRAWAGVIAVTALACGAAGAAFWMKTARESCAAGDARADAAWARGEVARALGDAPWAPRSVAALDEAAARWKKSYRHVCEARDAQSDTLLDLRMRCLDRALERFAAVAGSIAKVDAGARVAAPQAIADLPAPEPCEKITDAGDLALPTDPAQRKAVVAADRVLAGAWAAFALGRYRDAREQVDAIHLTGTDAPRVRAEVLALSAAIEARTGAPADAKQKLDAALVAAADANAPALEADIWARRLRDELFAGDPAKVIEWASFARAAAARAHRTDAEIDGIVAEALRDSGRLEQARSLLVSALAERRSFDTREQLSPTRRAVLQLNLASVELASGHSAAAAPLLEEARETVRKTFGDDHPELALYDDKLAAVARARGKLADARALHDRSLALRTAAFGESDRAVATSCFHRAQTELDASDLAGARADLARAFAIRTKSFGERSPRLGEIYAALADVELAAGNAQAARDALAHAAIDPRLDLTARRFAAGEKLTADDIQYPQRGELLSLDRAAAADALAQLLARAHKDGEVAALALVTRDYLRKSPDLDPALAVSLAHVLLVAHDPDAPDAYQSIAEHLREEPSRTADRVRAELRSLEGHRP